MPFKRELIAFSTPFHKVGLELQALLRLEAHPHAIGTSSGGGDGAVEPFLALLGSVLRVEREPGFHVPASRAVSMVCSAGFVDARGGEPRLDCLIGPFGFRLPYRKTDCKTASTARSISPQPVRGPPTRILCDAFQITSSSHVTQWSGDTLMLSIGKQRNP